MQISARYIQQFLTNGGLNRDALIMAEKECNPNRTRAYLSQLRPDTSEGIAEGIQIVSDLVENGQMVEAAVLRSCLIT